MLINVMILETIIFLTFLAIIVALKISKYCTHLTSSMVESRPSRGVLEEYLFCKEILWEIEVNIVYEEDVIFSPFFNFAGAEMRFSIHPNGTKRDPKLFCVRLLIPFETPQDTACESNPQRLVCDLTLKMEDFKSKVRPTVEDRIWKKSSTLISYGFNKKDLFSTEGELFFSAFRNLKLSCILKLKEVPKLSTSLRTLESEIKPVVFSSEVFSSPKGNCVTEFYSKEEKHFYSEKLIQDLKDLLLSENNSDVTIHVKGQEFKAHQSILGARTPVFKAMFNLETTEKATGIVKISDCEPEIFKDFLKYLYTGEVDCQSEYICGLFEIADKYQVIELRDECLECMVNNLSVDTFCDVIGMALEHCEEELLKLAIDFFCENTKDILISVKWQQFISKNPLYSNELFLKSIQYDPL